MFRKVLCTALAFVVFAVSLVACGSGDSSKNEKETTGQTQKAKESETSLVSETNDSAVASDTVAKGDQAPTSNAGGNDVSGGSNSNAGDQSSPSSNSGGSGAASTETEFDQSILDDIPIDPDSDMGEWLH